MCYVIGFLQLERHCKELEEVKKTKERYRLERNRYYHELDKQRRNYEAEKKRQQENINTLESQCDRMRVAFAQVGRYMYCLSHDNTLFVNKLT